MNQKSLTSFFSQSNLLESAIKPSIPIKKTRGIEEVKQMKAPQTKNSRKLKPESNVVQQTLEAASDNRFSQSSTTSNCKLPKWQCNNVTIEKNKSNVKKECQRASIIEIRKSQIQKKSEETTEDTIVQSDNEDENYSPEKEDEKSSTERQSNAWKDQIQKMKGAIKRDDKEEQVPSEFKIKKKPQVKRQSSLLTAPNSELKQISAQQSFKSTHSAKINEHEETVFNGKIRSETDINDARPYFIKEEFLMDANKRRPSDPGYDHTTLYIPEKEFKEFTPAMTQYWDIKRTNFDKILLFKLGKFYEIFYNDAIICQRLLDLNWMGDPTRLHVGFPEKALDKYLKQLVNFGYKAAVVEQTETPKQMEERLKKERGRKQKSEKCVHREVCRVVTKGTFKDPKEDNFEPRYTLTIKKYMNTFGVTFFDISTMNFHIGQFDDDENYSNFRTLLSQIRPVEVIHERELMNSDIMKMLKALPCSPEFTSMAPKYSWGVIKTCTQLERYLGPPQKWPESLNYLKNSDCELGIQSIGLTIAYLEQTLLDEITICTAKYSVYTPDSLASSLENMVLDSQALEHLEIIQSASGNYEGSLMHYIDHCKTSFGKRQLQRWLISPLTDIKKLNERLDAVEDLMRFQYETDMFRQKLSKIPDIEKNLAQLYTYSIRNRVKAIYFENIPLMKLKEFKSALKHMKAIESVCESLRSRRYDYKSERLRKLLTDESEDGLFPNDMQQIVEEFEGMIVWKKSPSGDEEIPEPQPGLDRQFDYANQVVESVKLRLNEYLEQIRYRFKDQRIQFSHAKYRYELEFPQELIEGKLKPSDFEFTSQRNGFQRFHTATIKELVDELEIAEESLKEAFAPFLCTLFEKFMEYKELWNGAVKLIAELDCLASLAIVSGSDLGGNMCRPEFLEYEGEYSNSSLLEIRQMRHPCVVSKQVKSFVPNDTLIDPNNDQTVLLVTGPNMGGKSTLLRQTCIAVILAQIGCYVPADSIRLTPVDRVFTRLGASDRILEGKSTFYIEMEETKNILSFATFKSLAIIDELGRGTSTFDGYSIAHSVLRYLANDLRCRSLFSTHYHMLLDEFREYPGVKLYHMACRANEEKDQVMFLYRFEQGECPMSFGLNVARMAGIPRAVIDNAKRKATEFNHKLNELNEKVRSQRGV